MPIMPSRLWTITNPETPLWVEIGSRKIRLSGYSTWLDRSARNGIPADTCGVQCGSSPLISRSRMNCFMGNAYSVRSRE